MSGKPGRFTPTNVYATGLLLVMLVWIANAWAFDPLFTMPEVIKEGKPLPGDTGAVTYPPLKDFSTPLLLGEALDLGLCNNPRIKEAWAHIKVQAGVVGEARAAYLPAVNAWAGYLYDSIRYPGSAASDSTVNNNFFGGGLTWRILDFGGRGANRRAANNLLAAALFNHDDTIQKTLSDIIQAYFDALTTKASWKAKAQNEEIARDTLDVARRREANGTTARSDTLQAATALAKVSLEKNRAAGAYHKAISVLIYSIGIPSQTSVVLPDDLGEMTGQEVADLDALMKDVQENHPAIQASKAKLEAARRQVTAARSEGLPSLDFSANYYQNARPGQSTTVSQTREYALGVTLNIPLFDGFSKSYKIQEAKAHVEQKEAELQDVEYRTLMDLVKAHADATSALQNLQAADALLKAAIESLEVSKRRYEKGAADILEMLNTQSALADARMEYIRCQAEWYAARLRLLASAGQLNRAAVDRGSRTISASDPGGIATSSATETVTTPPPASAPTVQLSAHPGSISYGGSTTLTWTATNAGSCTIHPDVGVVGTGGSLGVSPSAATTYTIRATGPGGTATSSVTVNIGSDHFQMTVQKAAGQPLVGVPVYLFDASDNYLSLSQTTDANGMAAFAVTGGSCKVRADYMANQFWSDVAQVTGDAAIILAILHQQVEVTVTASSGPLQGVPVYLFTDTASYLSLQQTTDAAGKVSFDLPVGKNFKFRADVAGNQYWSDVITVGDSNVNQLIINTSGG